MRKWSNIIIYALITVFLLVADQTVKWWAVSALRGKASMPVLPGIFEFVYVENHGIAFGMFANMQAVLIPLSVVILAVCIYFAWRYYRNKTTLPVVSLILIIAGAIGNLIDKIRQGYVVDFIHLTFMDFPVFNLADILICIGAALFVIYILFLDKEERKHENHL